MRMKTIIFLLLITTTSYGQLFVTGKYDPKMAHDGLGHDYGNEKAFNWEIEGGIELEKIRFSMAFEENHQIGYRKWTYAKCDWKLQDRLLWMEVDRFNQYAGAELSVIYRENQLHFNTENSLSAGINIELQYRIWRTVWIGAGLNYFLSEAALIRDDKKTRLDGMLEIIIKSR